MERSEQVNDLAAALVKAQQKIEGAKKQKENPHLKNKYADLGAVWDAIREPLAENGLSVTQWLRSTEHGVGVETMLMHTSGQFISGMFEVPVVKRDAQGYGSAATYARRYALMAALGVSAEDDDGEGAGKTVPGAPPARPAASPANGKPAPAPAAPKPPAGEPAAKAWVEQQRPVLETLMDMHDLTGWQNANAASMERLGRYPAVKDYLDALIQDASDRITAVRN